MRILSRKIFVPLAVILAMMIAVPACTGKAPAPGVLNLKIANYFPPSAEQSKLLAEFGRDLENNSGGRVKVKYFASGSLLTGPDMFNGIARGTADIGYGTTVYTPGRMPVAESLALPLGSPSGWVGSQVADDFYSKFRPEEFDSVRVLFLGLTGPSLVQSTRPVRKLEDLKG